MPVDTLYASSLLSGSVAGSSNALGSTSGTWTTDALNTNVSWTSVWHIDDPANPSVKASRTGAGTQTVTAFVRKGSNTGNPSWRLGVSQGGTELAFGTGTVTSTTGQAFSFVFDGSGITDITDIRITLDITGAGGGAGARNTAQVDYLYLLWDYNIKASTVSATTTVGAPSMSATAAATTVAGSTTVSGSAVTPVPAATVAATTTIGAPTVSGSVFAVPCGPGINWLRASAVFDGNINGWVSHNTSTVSYDASEGHTTPGSLKVIQTDGDNVVLSTVRTGYDHTIRYERVVYSLWVKTTVATQVRLTFRKVGSSVFVTQPAVTPGVWTRLDIDFINPTGFGDFLENIAFGVYASEPDTYWVDEVMVEYKSAQPASDFVINTAVPCTTTIGAPTVTAGGGNADVTATTVAGSTTVSGSAFTPVPAVTVAASTSISGSAFTPVPAVTVAASTTVSGSAVTPVPAVTVDATTTVSGSVVTPVPAATVAAVTTLAAPTFPAAEEATTVAAVTTVGSPTVATGSTVPASVVAATAEVPTPTVSVDSGATVTATTVAAVTSMAPVLAGRTRPYGYQHLLIA